MKRSQGCDLALDRLVLRRVLRAVGKRLLRLLQMVCRAAPARVLAAPGLRDQQRRIGGDDGLGEPAEPTIEPAPLLRVHEPSPVRADQLPCELRVVGRERMMEGLSGEILCCVPTSRPRVESADFRRTAHLR